MTQPITLQPGLPNLIPNKSLILENDKSLRCLDGLESITVQQDLVNDLQGSCGSSNTYNAFGNDGRTLFHVVESSSCLCRWSCGPSRKFEMEVCLPDQTDPILYFKRSVCHCEGMCCLDCYCCCANKILVYDINGQYLGEAIHRFTLFGEKFHVKDQNEKTVAQIKTSCFPCRFSRNVQFQTLYGNGVKNLGAIQKKWMGKQPNGISFDHESFQISFPSNLNVETKALLIGTAFLLNVVYFEMS